MGLGGEKKHSALSNSMNSHYLLGFDGGTALAGQLFVPDIVFLPVSVAVATLSVKSQNKIIKAQPYCTSYLFLWL